MIIRSIILLLIVNVALNLQCLANGSKDGDGAISADVGERTYVVRPAPQPVYAPEVHVPAYAPVVPAPAYPAQPVVIESRPPPPPLPPQPSTTLLIPPPAPKKEDESESELMIVHEPPTQIHHTSEVHVTKLDPYQSYVGVENQYSPVEYGPLQFVGATVEIPYSQSGSFQIESDGSGQMQIPYGQSGSYQIETDGSGPMQIPYGPSGSCQIATDGSISVQVPPAQLGPAQLITDGPGTLQTRKTKIVARSPTPATLGKGSNGQKTSDNHCDDKNAVCTVPFVQNGQNGYWSMREPDVINFIPNNVIKIEKLPNGSKNKVIYPNSEKYVGLNNILLKLNPSQYAYWMIIGNHLELLRDTNTAAKNGIFILHDGFIKLVEKVPLQSTPQGIWIKGPHGVDTFDIKLTLPAMIDNNKVYFVMDIDGKITGYNITTDQKDYQTIILADGTTVNVKPIKKLPADGYLEPKLNYNFIPVRWKKDMPNDDLYGIHLDGKSRVLLTPTNMNDIDFTIAFVNGVPVIVKKKQVHADGIFEGDGLKPLEISEQNITLPNGNIINGYWTFPKNGTTMFYIEVKESTPHAIKIIYNGIEKYVIRHTEVEMLAGYFVDDLYGARFINAPISLASVAGRKGFWILKDKLEYAATAPLSVRDGYWLTHNGKSYYVHVYNIKPNGIWKGKGPITKRTFEQAEIRAAKIGPIEGFFVIIKSEITFYVLSNKPIHETAILVKNGVQHGAEIIPLDLSSDGYFDDKENGKINFIKTEITPAFINDTDGYWINKDDIIDEFIPGNPKDNNGFWIITNGRTEYVYSPGSETPPFPYPEILVGETIAYIINKDNSDILVVETTKEDSAGFVINSFNGRMRVKPLLYNGIISGEQKVNGKSVFVSQSAEIRDLLINGEAGFEFSQGNLTVYLSEVPAFEANRTDKKLYEIFKNGAMIKVQEIDPVKMKIITMYTTEHSKDVSYKVVTKNTPGAHPHVINGKTVYLIPEND